MIEAIAVIEVTITSFITSAVRIEVGVDSGVGIGEGVGVGIDSGVWVGIAGINTYTAPVFSPPFEVTVIIPV